MTIGVPTFGAISRALGNITPVAPAFSAGDTVIAFTGEHYGADTLSGAPSAPWVERSANTNATGIRAFALYSTTGAEAMPTFNWGASNRGWSVCAVVPGVDATLATGFTPGDRGVNSTVTIFGPASTKTPSVNGCINFLFGAKNKTSASDATSFTASSGFTLGFSDVPAGSANPAVAISYQIQTTATTVAANQTLTGSVADATTQTSQGCIFSLQPSSTTPLAGTASVSASASGTLTSGAITGGASASTSAAAALTTAIQAAGSASAGITAVGSLTTWTTVTLAGAQYAGAGGIHDPNFWKDVDPPVGTTLYYDASKVTIYPNGEISATTNNCSAVVEFFDGTAWSVGIIIITPQMVSYASVVAASAGAMTTAITMAGAAFSALSVTGSLTAGIHLAGNALAIAQAAAALTTGIQLNAAALINITATGALSGGQASLQGNATVLSQALAQITTQIALAGQVAVNSTVAGALAAQIQLNAAAVALTQANAQIQTAIQLTGNANVVSSAAGAALLTTAFAGAANVVSSAMGSLLTGLLVAGNALVNAQATADLSTGITLAGGAIVDSAAAFKPPGTEAQFGRAVINVLSPTGLPVARSTFIAGSACIVTIAYYNAQGEAFVPNAVKYSVQDESTGFTLVPATAISTPELSNAITITGTQNTMINLSRNFELHQILFQITDGASQVSYVSAEFELVRAVGTVN